MRNGRSRQMPCREEIAATLDAASQCYTLLKCNLNAHRAYHFKFVLSSRNILTASFILQILWLNLTVLKVLSGQRYVLTEWIVELFCVNWRNKWLTLNFTKFHVRSSSHKHVNSAFSYYLNNTMISHTSSRKYFGVLLTADLLWVSHITSLCAKALRWLDYLRHNSRNSPADIRIHAFITLIMPQLEFALSMWSPHQKYVIHII